MPLTINLDRFQSAAFDACRPGRTVVLTFGRGSGKTFLLASLLHVLALQRPNLKIGLLLPSLKQARAVFWYPHLLPTYYGELKPHISKLNLSELSATYCNGSRVTTWGMENAGSIRGQRFDVLIQDECDDISPELEASIVEPTLSRAGASAIVVKAGTYTRGRYGILYRDTKLAQAGETGFVSFKCTSEQSPHVDQGWLAGVKRRINPRTYEREYLCNPDSAEGLVYPMFTEHDTDGFAHVRAPHPETVWQETIIGVDWGFEHAGVMLAIGVAGGGLDTWCHVIEESYHTGWTPGEWLDEAARLHERYPQARWYAGPDRPERILELKREIGLNIRGAANSVQEGIDCVAGALFVRRDTAEPYAKLYVAPQCEATIREFSKYRRRKDGKAEGQFLDDVEKTNDDALDALRYAMFSRFGRTLGAIHQDDFSGYQG